MVDDGLLLVVVKDDWCMCIEVGYGLEGVVFDVVVGWIICEWMVLVFCEGDYVGGIEVVVDELICLVDGEMLLVVVLLGVLKVLLG